MYPDKSYLYIGDNPNKDFETPNYRGWHTYGIADRGFNVHSQNINICRPENAPKYWLNSCEDLISVIKL